MHVTKIIDISFEHFHIAETLYTTLTFFPQNLYDLLDQKSTLTKAKLLYLYLDYQFSLNNVKSLLQWQFQQNLLQKKSSINETAYKMLNAYSAQFQQCTRFSRSVGFSRAIHCSLFLAVQPSNVHIYFQTMLHTNLIEYIPLYLSASGATYTFRPFQAQPIYLPI